MQAEVEAGHPCLAQFAVSLALAHSKGESQFARPGVKFGYGSGMCFPCCCSRGWNLPGKYGWGMIAGRWVQGALEAWGTHCIRSGATGQISRSGTSKYSVRIPVAQSVARPCRSISLYTSALASKVFGDLGMTVLTYESIGPPLAAVWRASSSVILISARTIATQTETVTVTVNLPRDIVQSAVHGERESKLPVNIGDWPELIDSAT